MKRLPIIVILIASLLNLTVGCDSQKAPVTPAEIDNGGSNEFAKAIPWVEPDEYPASLPTPLFATVLPNGDSVAVQDAYMLLDTVVVELTVVTSSEPVAKQRILKINNSLTGVIYTDAEGTPLAGYDIAGHGDTMATLDAWTTKDRFSMAVRVSQTGIHLQAATEADSCGVSLADSAELETAKILYNEIYVDGIAQKSDLTHYELDIVGRVHTWGTFIGGVSLDGEFELQTAELIMAQEPFVGFLGGQFGPQLFNNCGVRCICGIATMIATACIAVLPWCIPCWVPCVPAIGLSLACGMADFFGDLAD